MPTAMTLSLGIFPGPDSARQAYALSNLPSLNARSPAFLSFAYLLSFPCQWLGGVAQVCALVKEAKSNQSVPVNNTAFMFRFLESAKLRRKLACSSGSRNKIFATTSVPPFRLEKRLPMSGVVFLAAVLVIAQVEAIML